tara:strand:+ start:297 stop:515 length:219 start_codon:yes stop_codon:yes gene_type:complete
METSQEKKTAPLSLEQIQKGLEDRRLHTIKQKIGVSYPTLRKLADGKNSNPTTKTLEIVSEYLRNSAKDILS